MLETLLQENKKAIIERWFSLIVKTYPTASGEFFLQNRNRFTNPVGHTFSTEIENLFDSLLRKSGVNDISASLENINKIRAVQDFNASQAVAFIFFLKTAIRDLLIEKIEENQIFRELLDLESRIDGMALVAFDTFMSCREKLFEIRCNDIRQRSSRHFARPGKSSNNSIEEVL